MAVMRDLSAAQLVFQIVGGDPDQFHVIRYRGTEGLCQLFRFELDLVSVEPDMDVDKIVGTSAVLQVNGNDGQRFFHGIISRFESTGEGPGQAYFRVEIVPQLWLLTHRYQSRIFPTGKTAPEIIQDVLTGAGIPSDRIDTKDLAGTYPQREYCVQYRETDYNLVCRLMEEEGIWWYFRHSQEGHVLVLADGPPGYKPIEDPIALPFMPPTGMNVNEEHIFRFRRCQTLRPGVVTLNDFNFEDPELNLEGKHDLGRDKGLEFSDYPGEHKDQKRGADLARLRAEEFETSRVTATGQSNSPRLGPARIFELTEHPTAAHNGRYVVTSITYQGKQSTAQAAAYFSGRTSLLDRGTTQSLIAARQDQNGPVRTLADALLQIGGRLALADPAAQRSLSTWLYHAGQVVRDLATSAHALGGHPLAALAIPGLLGDGLGPGLIDFDAPLYECRFECIPASVAFRPPRVTPWPVMRGAQTARVVGPAGEEIHTDEYGRVKVQFPWDRQGVYDDKSSCWIRVSQGLAGGQYGMLFLPRVGQEVVVDFLEGDPDKPLIVGRVYNKDHMPAYKLPDEKTKSYIKTNSSKEGGGTNEIRFEDLKGSEQILINAQKDLHTRVGNQERRNVGETQHLVVTKEQRTKIGEHRSVEVVGKDALHVKDTRNLIVDGDVIEDFKSNHAHKVASQLYMKANELVIEADSGISLKVGGNFVVIDSSGVKVKGTKVGLNSGGSALSKSAADSPASPAAPEEADEVKPGKDKNYSGQPSELPPVEAKPYEGHWVSIDLKDDQGNPVAGEYYEITKPDGSVIEGTLDVNGYARVWVDTPGQCQITFPNRDKEEWQQG
jgi:uncharacterized protein involved in type VI secretion and phage assembly